MVIILGQIPTLPIILSELRKISIFTPSREDRNEEFNILNHLVDRDMAKAIRPNKNLKPGATLCLDITTFTRASGVLNSLPRNENLY